MSNPDVIVVGAGLSGLACARALVQSRVKVMLLEASDAPGGRVRTDVLEGFLLDRGFQVYLSAYPEGRQVLDLEALRLRPFVPGAKVRRGGRLHTVVDPLRRPLAGLGQVFGPVGTFGDKLRVLEMRQLSRSGEDEDVWLRPQRPSRRYLEEVGFTGEMVEGFLRPFFGGVFLDRALTTSSRFLEFVFRMFASGAVGVPEEGMGAIPAQLAAKLPTGVLRMQVPVSDVWGHRVRLEDGEQVTAKAVVVATEPTRAAALLPGMPVPTMNAVTCLYFAAPEPPVTGPWLVLNGEGRGVVNQLAVMSEVSPAYAPKGQALVSVSVLGVSSDEPALRARVVAELTEWFGSQVAGWRHLRTYSLPFALPAQTVDALEPPHRPVRLSPGLFVCGDHRDSASIQGALVSGRRAAEAVLRDFEM
ncbi:FAD-dependent oxidoreductase [Myxococcus sp. K15C18031901]|uniref:NAD(P)/FAD-dependent oxidoreductase n=1 Tax=Myxococcus dinghuensis TaxID=2906761 RepID=UPI0020A71B88|nr:FAD-dependent oxidoreductase [Myxococcus dinghuensis]MCP3102932.1 FAD-dependent oxidoreductase [Myxococcus dinghuensis]